MNDIELSAREFVNQNKNCSETYPHTFFRMASAKLKILMSNLNSGDKSGNAEEEMVSAARAALRSLVIEKKHICSNGVPYSFLLFTSYINKSGNAATTQSLSRFVNIVSVGHDFTVCELLTLRNFAVIACALKYADDGDIRCLSFFSSLENVDFEKIYIKYAKVHTIFSREKAAVYPNLCADTVRLYDERLLLMYDDEISGAEEIVARADTDGEHVGKYLISAVSDEGKAYFWLIFVLTFLFSALSFVLSNAVVAAVSVIPSYMLSKEIAAILFDKGGRPLPRVEFGEEIEKTPCTVCITTLLCGKTRDGEIFDLLEDCYLTNRQENLTFAVLADLREAEKKTLPTDAAIIKYAKARIEALNLKYGERFAIFIRRRRFAVCEKKYLGWERKRGAVIELCRYAKGTDGSFDNVVCGELVRGSKYVLTLDSDTRISENSVRYLLGIMLHPQNKAVVNKKNGRVISGYGIIQPKTAPSLFSTERSLFACFSSGSGGVDKYSVSSFDMYQSMFGRGIFCGKGMIDIDTFIAVCDGFFPRERILSHDLLEGALCGAAAVGDVVFTDNAPLGAVGYFSRAERWMRGDFQALAYIFGKVRNQSGEKIQNPMDALSKYMICDNILRASAPLFSVLLVMISCIYGNFPTIFPLIYTVIPLVKTLAWHVLSVGRRSLYCVKNTILSSARSSLFSLMSLGVNAGIFIKAATSVFISAIITKRGFLSWTTAAEYDGKDKNGILCGAEFLAFGVVFGILTFVMPMPASVFGSLWAIFPIVSYFLSISSKKQKRKNEFVSKLRNYAYDMWQYFEDNVNESSAYLPPDNVQYFPVYAVARRTSPTDIGLYMTSVLAARDFGFIGTDELSKRISGAITSINKMAKWNGHLYNWYSLPSLEVIGAPFVSSVDSGNLITCLTALCEGIKEYIGENRDLALCVKQIENIIKETDFSKLVDNDRGILSIGYDVGAGKLSSSCYDTLISESRSTSYYLEATGALRGGYYFSLGRKMVSYGFSAGAASWSGTAFEYFMPSLFLPSPHGSLMKRTLAHAFRAEKRRSSHVPGKKYSVFGISESCFFGFDSEMIYQYRAFGINNISLDPKTNDENVISPYSSFLMLCENSDAAMKNLSRLADAGMYGKYGFYESMDLCDKRVGRGYAVIKSFMSHHLGMSVLAAASYCFNGIFQKRFMSNPSMRSCRELLGERAPTGERIFKKKTDRPQKNSLERKSRSVMPKRSDPEHAPTLLDPEIAMLSNNKTRLVASSSGHISIYDGGDALIIASDDKYSLGGGLRIYARVGNDLFISPVPLGFISNGVVSSFEFYADGRKIKYASTHIAGRKIYEFDVELSLRDDSETADILCRIGGADEKCALSVYFEPIMTDVSSFEAHKCFSNLFIESRYFPDERALVFVRRSRSGTEPQKYLGVSSSGNTTPISVSSEREKLLPLMYGEREIAHLLNGKVEYSDGAPMIPSCFFAIETSESQRTRRAEFTVGYSHDCDDLLYTLSSSDRGTSGNISKLQLAVSGGDIETVMLERHVLSKMIFGAHGVKNFGMADAVSKIPLKIDGLWRHGISGDYEIVCTLFYDKNTQSERLRALMRMFKYSRIRGIKFDLAVICMDDDRYNMPQIKSAKDLLTSEGLLSFAGCRAGVFIIDNAELSYGERTVITECSAAYFDLSMPISFYLSRKSCVLYDEIIRNIISKSQKIVAARDIGKKCVIDINGVRVNKGKSAPPWAHVLASQSFGTVLSENSIGFTYFSNSSLGKLTPHNSDGMTEDDGEVIILRIKSESGSRDIDAAAFSEEVSLGFDFAEYRGKVDGIEYSLRITLDGKMPSKKVEVSLFSENEAFVDVIYSVVPCCGSRVKIRETAIRAEKGKNAVFFSRVVDRNGRNIRGAIFGIGTKTQIFTDRTALLTCGKIFGNGNDVCAVCDRTEFIGTHVTTFRLAAAATDEALGVIIAAANKNRENQSCIIAVPQIKTYDWTRDILVNRLLPNQTIASRFFARSGFYQVGGAFGFRDQLQDAISLIPYRADLARRQILFASCHQYEDGSVMHWWHQFGYPHAGIRSRCSDDSAWLSFSLCEYVEKTGDTDILFIQTPYLSSPPLSDEESERYERAPHSKKRDPVIEHALKGLKRTFRTGAHGLSLIGTGDWNDGMNRVGRLGRGESVWLAFFSALCAFRLSRIYESLGNEKTAIYLLSHAERLIGAAKETFDGSWFLRGYYDDGAPLGAKSCDECAVDIMPQAFAAVAASEIDESLLDFSKTALKNASEVLFDRKNGVFRLLWPPFYNGASSPGYIKGYVPGIRENGGQYTHAAVFAALGMLRAGMNREGAEILFALDPTKKNARIYKVEPYVISGDVYSNEKHVGRGGWSWYTGAAGWYRTVFIEELCGYRQYPSGFSILPRFSDLFDEFELAVEKNGCKYHVKVRRSKHEFIECDGHESKNFFRFDGGVHDVSIFTSGVGFLPPDSKARLTFRTGCDTIIPR